MFVYDQEKESKEEGLINMGKDFDTLMSKLYESETVREHMNSLKVRLGLSILKNRLEDKLTPEEFVNKLNKQRFDWEELKLDTNTLGSIEYGEGKVRDEYLVKVYNTYLYNKLTDVYDSILHRELELNEKISKELEQTNTKDTKDSIEKERQRYKVKVGDILMSMSHLYEEGRILKDFKKVEEELEYYINNVNGLSINTLNKRKGIYQELYTKLNKRLKTDSKGEV